MGVMWVLGGSGYGVLAEFLGHSFLTKTTISNNGQELCGQATICPLSTQYLIFYCEVTI